MRRFRMLGGDLHPFYRAVLLRALGQSYELPSAQCQRLQNLMVQQLTTEGIWARMDYLYIYAHDGGTSDMAKINWIYPTRTLSSGSPGYTHKKGIYGALTHFWDPTIHRIAMTSAVNSSMGCLVTVAGPTPVSFVNVYIQFSGTNFSQAIRLRVTPRVDQLFNTGNAGPTTFINFMPSNYDHFLLDNALQYRNGVSLGNSFNGGAVPDLSSLYTTGIDSNRAVGLAYGGGSISAISKTVQLNTILQSYISNLQLLP